MLIRAGADVNMDMNNVQKRSALNVACFHNNYELTKILLAAGATGVNAKCHFIYGGLSAMDNAKKNKNKELIQLLERATEV